MSDPYSILGVARDATDDQIKAAYRRLAMQYHPDRNPGDHAAEEKFKEIGQAYEALKDPVKRQFASGGGPNTGTRYTQRGPGHFEFSFSSADGVDFGDIFGNFQAARQHRNNDLQTGCRIGLEQALHGCEIELEMRTRVGPRLARLTIPAGVETGVRLRVLGEGERVYGNLPPGDLYVTVEVTAHPRFERVSQNLVTQARITAFDAMLGANVAVTTLDDTTIYLSVPAGTQPGQRLRIPGHGMTILGAADVRGDLLVRIEVTTPTGLTQEQVELLSKVRDLSSTSS